MKPSVLSTSSTRSRCLDPGIETFDLFRICALRIRAIMSPIGSFTIAPSSPARLHKAWNEAFGAKLAQCDTTQAMLTVISARTPTQFAPIANARFRGIARQFSQLQSSGKTLLHRQLLVVCDRFELRAPVGKFLCHLAPPVVLLDRTLLSHTFAPCGSAYKALLPYCRNGKLNAVSNARASSSLRALVQTVMSRPQVSVTLSKSISGNTVYSLMPRLKLPRPSKLFGLSPRKSRMRGSTMFTSRSTKSYMRVLRSVTLQPMAWPSRSLYVAID